MLEVDSKWRCYEWVSESHANWGNLFPCGSQTENWGKSLSDDIELSEGKWYITWAWLDVDCLVRVLKLRLRWSLHARGKKCERKIKIKYENLKLMKLISDIIQPSVIFHSSSLAYSCKTWYSQLPFIGQKKATIRHQSGTNIMNPHNKSSPSGTKSLSTKSSFVLFQIYFNLFITLESLNLFITPKSLFHIYFNIFLTLKSLTHIYFNVLLKLRFLFWMIVAF